MLGVNKIKTKRHPNRFVLSQTLGKWGETNPQTCPFADNFKIQLEKYMALQIPCVVHGWS